MSFKSILVHLTSDQSCLQRLAFVDQLTTPGARRIHGCYFLSDLALSNNQSTGVMMVPESVDWIREPPTPAASKTKIQEDIYMTRKLIDESSLKGEWQWCTANGDLLNHFTESCTFHDLAIVSKRYFDGFNEMPLKFTLPDLNKPLACPIYILTDNVLPDYFPTRPLVVWDGAVETARTLKQAMPLLKASGKAGLLSCLEGSDENDVVMMEELAALLHTHGVTIDKVHGANAEQTIAASVRDTVTEYRYDLVVLGYSGDSVFQKLTDSRLIDQIMEDINVPLFVGN